MKNVKKNRSRMFLIIKCWQHNRVFPASWEKSGPWNYSWKNGFHSRLYRIWY
jgi:hypothetical protein